jgi:ATP synthase protein I
MTEPDDPSSLKNLDERLSEAQARRSAEKDRGKRAEGRSSGSGMGLGFRVAVDILAALMVGVGIGVLLDRWLGTKPWMLIVFFLLGSAAGIMNVFRVMRGYGYSVGYEKTERDKDEEDREPGDRPGPRRE